MVVVLFSLFLYFRSNPHDSTVVQQSAIKTEAVPPTINIIIKDRQLMSPTSPIKLVQNQPVSLNIISNSDDELHIHGLDIAVPISSSKSATLNLNPSISGQFPFEIEESHIELGKFEVQPE